MSTPLALVAIGLIFVLLVAADMLLSLKEKPTKNFWVILIGTVILGGTGAYLGADTLNGVANQVTSIPTTSLTGALQAAQEPAHTGDMTNSAGSLATAVVALNGTSLSGLTSGLLYNTTSTGVPSTVSGMTSTAIATATAANSVQTPCASCTLSAAGVLSTGVAKFSTLIGNSAQPGISGCSATIGTGATNMAGSYTSGTTGTCTVTLTVSVASAHGPVCIAQDITTLADTQSMTSNTTTTAVISGTTVTGDVIRYLCIQN